MSCLLCMIVTPKALAKQRFKIRWYKTKLLKSNIPNHSRVILSGKTHPLTQIIFDHKNIIVIEEPKKTSPIDKQKELLNKNWERTISDSKGDFEIPVYLPHGLLQVSIQLQKSKDKKKFLTVLMDVSPDRVIIKAKLIKKKPRVRAQLPPKMLRLFIGLGFNYHTYSQQVDATSDVNYNSFKAPSLLAQFEFLSQSWGIETKFSQSEGELKTSTAPFNLSETTYQFTEFEVNGLFSPSAKGKSQKWRVSIGAQYFVIPFLALNQSNTARVEEHKLTSVGFGLQYHTGGFLSDGLGFSLKYWLPIQAEGQSPNEFSVTPNLALSSSVSYKRYVNTNYFWGAQWDVLYQDISFNFINKVDNLPNPNKGKQVIFSNSFNLLFGYQF